MELFHEYQNRFVHAAVYALNRLADKGIMNRTEFEKIYFQYAEAESTRFGETLIQQLENSPLLYFPSPKTIALRFPVKIMFPLSVNERIWLRFMLEQPLVSLFLDDEECQHISQIFHIDKVPDLLSHIENISHYSFQYPDIQNFHIVLQAIFEKRYLTLTNHQYNGEKRITENAVPMKIEYSALTQRFYVSLWNAEEERPFKAVLTSLSNLKIGEKIEIQLQKNIALLMQSKKCFQPLRMKIFPEKNTPERAIQCFSQYDMLVFPESDGSMIAEVYYYQFDEYELLGHLLSFGPYIKVLSPESVVQKIIQYLRNI